MNRIIPVASGKGGVGKSTISSSLAVLLASSGRTVVAVDLDLGGSNLHTCFGLKNTYEGISRLLKKSPPPLVDLIVETSWPRLFFLPGDNLLPGSANLPFFIKKKIITALEKMPADFVIVDLGSGTHFNVIDFFLISTLGLLITAPETTAILNAYSFLKNAIFRMLDLLYEKTSHAKTIIKNFGELKIEGGSTNINSLIDELLKWDLKEGQKAQKALQNFRPGIVVNMVRTPGELTMAANLNEIIKKNLSISPSFLGILPWEDLARTAVNTRVPLAQTAPQGLWTQSLTQFAQVVYGTGETSRHDLLWDEQDLEDAEKSAQDLGLW